MQQAMQAYFEGERAEAVLIFMMGVAAIGLSLVLLSRYGGPLIRGLTIPLMLVGLIQLVVGGTVFTRTPAQAAALSQQLKSAPQAYRAAETARMATVMKSFTTYKIIEVVFIVVGLLGTLFVTQSLWLGIAMGMLVQGAVMLPLDIVAEGRGRDYLAAIAQVK
jgi:hypothetical protein